MYKFTAILCTFYLPNTYTHHDQLFKELIHHFIEEFLEAFFPKVHEFIDFQSTTLLSEEMFTDLHEGYTTIRYRCRNYDKALGSSYYHPSRATKISTNPFPRTNVSLF